MKCDSCNAETKVLETRTKSEHWVERRHKCVNGHTFWTVQVRKRVFDAQRQWIQSAYEESKRGVERRRREFAKRYAVEAMLRAGVKWAVIQIECGVSEGLVKKVKRTMKEKS